jgi:hypothetical protein
MWNAETVALFETLIQQLSAEAEESQENIIQHNVCLIHWKWEPSEYQTATLPL